MRDLLFGLIWAVMLPLSFYSAHLGVLLWMWVALISPNDLMYGIVGSVPFNKLVAVSALFMLIASGEKHKFYVDKLIVLVGMYSVVVLLSYITQSEPNTFSDFLIDKFWKIIVLMLLITGTLWTRHRLHQAALVVSLGFGFLMVKEALIFLLTAGGHKIEGSPATGDNNGLALAILMTIPFTLYVAKYSAVPWVRRVLQITAGLGVVTVIATFSRGGFVGLLVLGFMMLQGSKYKVRTALTILVLAGLAYTFAPDSYFQRVDTIKQASEDDSFTIRLVSWKINFLIAVDNPLLGGGPDASISGANWFHYLERSSTFLFPTPMIPRSFVAHSIYFQTLGDTGFTGFFLFVAILLTGYFKARRTRRLARGDPSLVWAADLAFAMQVAIAVYMVSGAALSLVYFELLFILLAMISRTHRSVVELTSGRTAAIAAPVRRGLAPAYRRAA